MQRGLPAGPRSAVGPAPLHGPLAANLPHRARLSLRTSVQAPETEASTSAAGAGPTDKVKPDWTGDSVLSRVVNAAIGFPPLFSVMKLGARAAIKGTAEKRGIPWDGTVVALQASDVFKVREEVENKDMTYPSYYTQPFHGYDEGNLNWKAAFEVEPATEAMALRVWKEELELAPLDAQRRLRAGIYDALRAFSARHGLREPADILDIGCSVGVSTRWLAEEFPAAAVTGLDLSPQFLAVAELRERQWETEGSGVGPSGRPRRRIAYLHANFESSGLPDAAFDLVAAQFVMHECPARVLTALVAEARRLVRPDGVVLLADNNPRSKVIQGLPPVLFTLMKSTEPWSDEYYAYDVEVAMAAAGLEGVVTVESDPRHRAVMGFLPPPGQ